MAEPASMIGALYGNLRLLRVYLEPVPSGYEVVFEAFIGDTRLARLAVPAGALGLPQEWKEDFEGSRLEVPEYLKRSFAVAFDSAEATQEPVWIDIRPPTGFLPSIQWERALRPELKMPLFRLPQLPFKPYVPRDDLHIGICFALPEQYEDKNTVAAVLGAIPPNLAPAVHLHVFANPPVAEICRNLPLGGSWTVIVHAGGEAGEQPEGPRSGSLQGSSNLSDPLLWMGKILGANRPRLDAIRRERVPGWRAGAARTRSAVRLQVTPVAKRECSRNHDVSGADGRLVACTNFGWSGRIRCWDAHAAASDRLD